MTADLKTVIVRIDPVTHRRLKILAAERDTSIQALVSQAITSTVNQTTEDYR